MKYLVSLLILFNWLLKHFKTSLSCCSGKCLSEAERQSFLAEVAVDWLKWSPLLLRLCQYTWDSLLSKSWGGSSFNWTFDLDLLEYNWFLLHLCDHIEHCCGCSALCHPVHHLNITEFYSVALITEPSHSIETLDRLAIVIKWLGNYECHVSLHWSVINSSHSKLLWRHYYLVMGHLWVHLIKIP